MNKPSDNTADKIYTRSRHGYIIAITDLKKQFKTSIQFEAAFVNAINYSGSDTGFWRLIPIFGRYKADGIFFFKQTT